MHRLEPGPRIISFAMFVFLAFHGLFFRTRHPALEKWSTAVYLFCRSVALAVCLILTFLVGGS
mgnify:CR=1 FL=1